MHSFQRALLFAILALSLFHVDAYTVKARSGANALRFARGQPPARPKRFFHPGQNVARDLNPSATPTDPSSSESPSSSASEPATPASSSPDVPMPPPTSSSSDSSIPDPTPSSSGSASSSVPADPSSSSSAPPTPTAPAPGTVVSGYVGIYASTSTQPAKRDDTFIGYIGAYGITTVTGSSASAAWTYSYTVPSTPGTSLNMEHPGTPYRLTAVAIRTGPQVTLGPGNTYYAEVQNSRANTPVGSATSTYVYDTYAIGYAQSAVWRVDPITGVVTCQWVNPDGSTPRTYLVKSGTNLYITGDLNALRSQLGNPTDFVPATLYHLADN